MRPSVQNSLLLAVGLAVAASSLRSMDPHEVAADVIDRTARLAEVAPGASPPRLVLLPATAAPAPLALARARPAGVTASADPEAARAAFRRRAERLLADRLTRERQATP